MIRDINPELMRKLEESARRNQRSVSEEAKVLLAKAAASESERKLGTELFNMIWPEDRGDDLVFEVREGFRTPPELE